MAAAQGIRTPRVQHCWTPIGGHYHYYNQGENGAESDHGFGPQEFFEESLALAGVLVFHSHRKGLPCPDEDSEVFGPGQASVHQVPEEHLEMLVRTGMITAPNSLPCDLLIVIA